MVYTLYSAPCTVNGDSHYVSICFDVDEHQDPPFSVDQFVSSEENNHVLRSLRMEFSRSPIAASSPPEQSDQNIFFSRLLSIKSLVHEHSETSVAQVHLQYADVSESLIWTIEQEQIEMDSKSATQFCLTVTKLLSKFQHRPKTLLVFVNPQCGKGKAQNLYKNKVLSLFEEANIQVKTVYTERPNHARDYVQEQSIDHYDGLVCVGGDGMFSELCHGLLIKTAKQHGLDLNDRNTRLVRPKLRIGVIPAGSTDAVVFGTTGHNDPVTSALQIILGESVAIDMTTVHNEKGFVRFMATMFAYGFFGNIIHQSDHWRIFGPLRYNLAGFVQFLRNTSYHTEVTIIPPPEPFSTKALVQNLDQALIGSQPQQNVNSGEAPAPSPIHREGRYRTVNCLNMPGRCDKSKYGMSPSVHPSDGSFDLMLVKNSWSVGFLRFLTQVAHDGRTVDELPNVERFRAVEAIIRPIVKKRDQLGHWACDGELIEAREVRIRAHPQALNLFATGVHLEEIKRINEEDAGLIERLLQY